MPAGGRRSGGRWTRAGIIILLLAWSLAGCGSSAPPGPSAEQAGTDHAAHPWRLGGLASCLREKGVEIPTAASRGPGVDLSRVDTAQHSFARAWGICRDRAGGGSFRPPAELNPALSR